MQLAGSDFQICGVLDDSPSKENLDRLSSRNIEYLGTVDDFLDSAGNSIQYLIGIGDPKIRKIIARKMDLAERIPFTAVHPSAIVGSSSRIGPGSIICAGVIVSTNVELGFHAHLNPGVVIGHDSVISDFASINPSATISGEVSVLSGTLVGANATVLQNLIVGRDVLIGAAAVVTKNIPDNAIAKGVPARW